MTLNPRHVDERDTQWEIERPDLRVFIYRADGAQDAIDFDQATLASVEAWIRREAPGGSKYEVALRTEDAEGRPGLIWLVRESENEFHSASRAAVLDA